MPDEALHQLLQAVLRLRKAGIAHGALGIGTIIISTDGICLRDFRCASSSAPQGRLDGDLAATLAAVAVRVGAERTAAAAARVLDTGAARSALVHLQRSALDPETVAALQQDKDLLPRLRAAVATAAGIEMPQLAEAKRVSWASLLFGIGTLIGVWALLGILADVRGSLTAIEGASWGWVALAFVLAQLPVAAEAWALIGAVPGQLPTGGASRSKHRTPSPPWSVARSRYSPCGSGSSSGRDAGQKWRSARVPSPPAIRILAICAASRRLGA